MLELEADAGDDPSFLDIAGRLIAGAAVENGFGVLVAVHIDHWFGDRWLGFCGKLLGAAGVRNRRLTDELTPPPFHPHRVRSARAYELTESGRFEFWEDVRSLHDFRSSEANVLRTLRGGRLYGWYTGDTVASDKAAVMAYLVGRKWNAAWYVGFDKARGWHVSKTVAIAPRRVQEFLEGATP
jgi:hypothetical protein